MEFKLIKIIVDDFIINLILFMDTGRFIIKKEIIFLFLIKMEILLMMQYMVEK